MLHIDFSHVAPGCEALKEPLRWTLMAMLRTHATATVENYFWELVYCTRALSAAGLVCSWIGVLELQTYKASLARDQEWRLSRLHGLLKRWFRLGHPGVRGEAIEYLRSMRLAGQQKGHPVRTHDPFVGPLTQREYTLLYRNLEQAYGAGELEPWAFVLARLLFATGARISQYASMKLCDLQAKGDDTDDPGAFYVLVPQVKKGEVNPRNRLEPADLSPQTGQLLSDYINEARRQGCEDTAPLFPSRREDAGEGEFKGHCAADELSRRFRAAIGAHVPESHRLNGADLPVAPVRFRYTLGTRLVEERCSKAVVAQRLWHADLQHVDVYFEASPQIIENIDKSASELLTPIAQSFRGRLIEDDSQASLADAPGSKIHDFRVSSKTLASCSELGGCGFNKPVACYTCHRFEPWLDGDHEGFLKRLLADRERHRNDPRVADVNDDTIEAVKEVIALCAAVRAERNGESANG